MESTPAKQTLVLVLFVIFRIILITIWDIAYLLQTICHLWRYTLLFIFLYTQIYFCCFGWLSHCEIERNEKADVQAEAGDRKLQEGINIERYIGLI